MTRTPKLDWVESEDDKQKLLEAWQRWETGKGTHHLMVYHALSDEIWLKQNPQDAAPWTNDHQPSVFGNYFGDD
jgi:hypothetical protein